LDTVPNRELGTNAAGTAPAYSLRRLIEAGLADANALSRWLGDAADLQLATEIFEDVKYAPYLERQERELRDLRAAGRQKLPKNFQFEAVPGLSREMVERLSASRPTTIAEAEQVRGITPAALAAVLVHARRHAEA
jgi:tRNA uridine 5-carboxymethylaminomethyl modification enzyme